ncbi:MAG: Type 1 glutamine amidotransferase-like domain-containing protein [Nanoarchaeota archaeon]
MQKLLLTSTGLSNKTLVQAFLELISKPVVTITVLFIPTASQSHVELEYVKESKQELFDLGVRKDHLKVLQLDHTVTLEDVDDVDVIYVCGGNTFYLLDRMRKSRFDTVVKSLVAKDVVYIGVSAGSIVAGPSIEIAGMGIPPDENDVAMNDFTGLGLVDFVVTPHYCKAEKEMVQRYKKVSKYEVVTLTDSQGIVVEGKRRRLVS